MGTQVHPGVIEMHVQVVIPEVPEAKKWACGQSTNHQLRQRWASFWPLDN